MFDKEQNDYWANLNDEDKLEQLGNKSPTNWFSSFREGLIDPIKDVEFIYKQGGKLFAHWFLVYNGRDNNEDMKDYLEKLNSDLSVQDLYLLGACEQSDNYELDILKLDFYSFNERYVKSLVKYNVKKFAIHVEDHELMIFIHSLYENGYVIDKTKYDDGYGKGYLFFKKVEKEND